MDVKRKLYNAVIRVSGAKDTTLPSGPLLALLASVASHLNSVSARADSQGDIKIQIQISSGALTKIDESIDKESEIIQSLLGAGTPESLTEAEYESMYGAHAEWVNDPKAQRFRRMNASSRNAQDAQPEEWDSLLRYCREKYPDQMSTIQIRR